MSINPADKLAVERIGPITVIACALGALVNGLALPWLCATAVAGIITFTVRHEVRSGGLRRHRASFVDTPDLDAIGLAALRSTQRAIDAVLASDVYKEGRLDHAANAADLRQHEWEIACRLRAIAIRRWDYIRTTSAGVPGPQTAAVLNAHSRAIAFAQDATARSVNELRRYSSVVEAADLAIPTKPP